MTDAGLTTVGTIGPLTVTSGQLQVGLASAQSLPSRTGALSVHVAGEVSLDSTSVVIAAGIAGPSTPGTRAPQLTASGTVALNGAQLGLSSDCSPSLSAGDVLTLLGAEPDRQVQLS